MDDDYVLSLYLCCVKGNWTCLALLEDISLLIQSFFCVYRSESLKDLRLE